jgi:putative transposase
LQLVEQHIIKHNNKFYKEIDNLCFLSKNLYNSCLYKTRQEFIHNKNNIIFELYQQMKNSDQYKALPSKIAISTVNMVQQNFKAFFAALKSYNTNPSKFNGRPRLPKYLDKEKGRFIVSYTNQAISKKVFKKVNKIKLSKTNIEFHTKINDFNIINCVRLVPRNGYYVIEVVYTIPDKEKLENNNQYLSIDLGVNNLVTLTSNNNDLTPVIINGKPLKSMNQYYNKKLGEYKSKLDHYINNKGEKVQCGKSKKIYRLTLKRKNKIDNYLHKASKEIVKIAKENNLNVIIIGKNNNWKQDLNIGKINNQNFVQIPHSRFIEMISYKCEIEGINVIIQEESYTSAASFLNLDKIPVYKKGNNANYEFSGYRPHRGLYKVKNEKRFINADVNGSYNILRKAIPNVFTNGIEGLEVNPILKNVSI